MNDLLSFHHSLTRLRALLIASALAVAVAGCGSGSTTDATGAAEDPSTSESSASSPTDEASPSASAGSGAVLSPADLPVKLTPGDRMCKKLDRRGASAFLGGHKLTLDEDPYGTPAMPGEGYCGFYTRFGPNRAWVIISVYNNQRTLEASRETFKTSGSKCTFTDLAGFTMDQADVWECPKDPGQPSFFGPNNGNVGITVKLEDKFQRYECYVSTPKALPTGQKRAELLTYCLEQLKAII